MNNLPPELINEDNLFYYLTPAARAGFSYAIYSHDQKSNSLRLAMPPEERYKDSLDLLYDELKAIAPKTVSRTGDVLTIKPCKDLDKRLKIGVTSGKDILKAILAQAPDLIPFDGTTIEVMPGLTAVGEMMIHNNRSNGFGTLRLSATIISGNKIVFRTDNITNAFDVPLLIEKLTNEKVQQNELVQGDILSPIGSIRATIDASIFFARFPSTRNAIDTAKAGLKR